MIKVRDALDFTSSMKASTNPRILVDVHKDVVLLDKKLHGV
jgi:hypothetical protein